MGPSAVADGEHEAILPQPGVWWPGFNGAVGGSRRREKKVTPTSVMAILKASMGPSAVADGEAFGGGWEKRLETASMGPSAVADGEVTSSARRTERVIRFNGAVGG